jgi:hypothetical protein
MLPGGCPTRAEKAKPTTTMVAAIKAAWVARIGNNPTTPTRASPGDPAGRRVGEYRRVIAKGQAQWVRNDRVCKPDDA